MALGRGVLLTRRAPRWTALTRLALFWSKGELIAEPICYGEQCTDGHAARASVGELVKSVRPVHVSEGQSHERRIALCKSCPAVESQRGFLLLYLITDPMPVVINPAMTM